MWLASVDGAIGPVDDARIPVADDGLLRGDGAFEVVRVYGGVPYAWEQHLARLGRTCAVLRLVLTRGGRGIAIVEPLPLRSPTARVATITYAPTRVLNGLKTLSYAGNMLAGRLAGERGADEALFVTPHGRVLEGPTWTFFWASGGRL